MPIVFLFASLNSNYLVMGFSPWHPISSPNYCRVFISLTDINQFCRKPALPNRQAPTPGLAQHSWCCQWQSLCESLLGDTLAGRAWKVIRKYFPCPGSCIWTLLMLPSGLGIHRALSAFHRKDSQFDFQGRVHVLYPSCLQYWSLSLLKPSQATSKFFSSVLLPVSLPSSSSCRETSWVHLSSRQGKTSRAQSH